MWGLQCTLSALDLCRAITAVLVAYAGGTGLYGVAMRHISEPWVSCYALRVHALTVFIVSAITCVFSFFFSILPAPSARSCKSPHSP